MFLNRGQHKEQFASHATNFNTRSIHVDSNRQLGNAKELKNRTGQCSVFAFQIIIFATSLKSLGHWHNNSNSLIRMVEFRSRLIITNTVSIVGTAIA